MTPFYIQSVDSVTVLKSDGTPFTLTNDQPAYDRLIRAILAGDQYEIAEIADVALALGDLLGEFGEVTVYHGHVIFRGEPLHNYLVQRIVEMVQTRQPFEPMANLLNNVLLNPSRRAVQDLYRWLEAGNLPITPDGHIVAYKIVRSDFMDVRSGTFDNTPGNVCEMPRNMVNEDFNQTCAEGLHFCSAEYLPAYGGFSADRKIVLVKVHPRDVVAFPTDYNLSKARCCRYEVLQEIDQAAATTFFPKDEFVFGTEDWTEDWTDYEDDYEAKTILTRIEAIECALWLVPAGQSIPERLDAIDFELGLDNSLTPMIARIDRAESQLGLS